MAATQALVDEITQLLACDLGESALHLAELECRPRLSDASMPAGERLQLARAYAASLRAQQQHRAALRATAEFIASARGQLLARDVEAAARDMADMRWALGEADLCLAQLRQIPRAHRTTGDWARMARCAAALGQHGEAAGLYAEVQRAQPNASEAMVYSSGGGTPNKDCFAGVAALARALALMRRLDYAGALAELRRLSRRRGHAGARVVALQASCRFQLGDDAGARALFERAAALDAALFDEMGAYAALLARQGDRLAVYALARRLLRGDVARAEGWVAMARFLALAGRAQEALGVAWKAQALAPRLAAAFDAEGAAQLAAGCAADAAAAFARAHALAPSAHSYGALAGALVRSGRLKDAFACAREAAEKMPRHAATLAMVGAVLSHSAEGAASASAERLLRAALAIDRRSAEAVDALAALHVAAGRVADAAALLARHLPEIPTAAMHATYADVLTLANDLPQAQAHYATALHIDPANARARAGYDRVDRLLHPLEEEEEEEEELEEEELEEVI
ncbi:Anaphase promoting complex subunit 7 [Coemansia sp. RSA 25]|nr:Anaphase promoting complex subunit 7 [Coemansia sp. RSA 25]